MKEIKLKGLNETIYYDECENGLPIFMWVREKGKGYYLTLSVKYGSLDTEFKIGSKSYQVPNGVAHFLEHLNFKDGQGENAQDFFQKNGSDVNAFTTFQYTSYEVYGSECLKEDLDYLLHFVMTPYFNKKMVMNEKNIIVEENKMDLDNPSNHLYYGTYQNVFHVDKHRNYITGSKEDILNTSLEDIELIFHTFYHPSNMFLVVTGNFNPYEVVKVVKENQNRFEIPKWVNPKRKLVKEPVKIVKDYEKIVANVEIPKIRMAVKIPRKSFLEKDDVKLRIMLSLIMNNNFGPTSYLYEELISKDLILGMSGSKSIIGDYVLLFLNAETKYPEEIVPILKEAFRNLKMDEKELVRKLHSSIANMVLAYDDITNVNTGIQEQIMNYGRIIDNKKEICESIRLQDIKKTIEHIKIKEMAIVVLDSE